MRSEKPIQVFGTLIGGVISSWVATRIDHNPLMALKAGLIGAAVVAFLVLAINYNLLQYLVSFLFNLEAIVVSVLVFDEGDVLLVKDNWRRPPWMVPPSAHVGLISAPKEGPHQAVIRSVKNWAGIDIEIHGPYRHGIGATQIPHPFRAQSENQQRYEGHSIHHDFYYIGSVVGTRRITKFKETYEWVRVNNLGNLEGMVIPHELIKIIEEAFDRWKQSKSRDANLPRNSPNENSSNGRNEYA